MSADFFSFVAWMKPAKARRLFADLAGAKLVIEDVVDPNGSAVYDPAHDPFERRTLARVFRGKVPPPEDYAGAYVDIGSGDATREGALLERFGKASLSVFGPNAAAIVVVDRILAIPNGVSFMRGQPMTRLRALGVARLANEWPKLMSRVGGPNKAAVKIAKYFGRSGNDVAKANAMLAAITHGIAMATAEERDLLLVGMSVP